MLASTGPKSAFFEKMTTTPSASRHVNQLVP